MTKDRPEFEIVMNPKDPCETQLTDYIKANDSDEACRIARARYRDYDIFSVTCHWS